MTKDNCLNCSNSVGKGYCTMQKNMTKAMYQQCNGFTQVPKHESIANRQETYEDILKRKARLEMMYNKGMEDENFESVFLRFVKKGGGYSIPQDRKVI